MPIMTLQMVCSEVFLEVWFRHNHAITYDKQTKRCFCKDFAVYYVQLLSRFCTQFKVSLLPELVFGNLQLTHDHQPFIQRPVLTPKQFFASFLQTNEFSKEAKTSILMQKILDQLLYLSCEYYVVELLSCEYPLQQANILEGNDAPTK